MTQPFSESPLPPAVAPGSAHRALFRAIFASDAEFHTCYDAWRAELGRSPSLDTVSLQHIALLYPRLAPDQIDALSQIIRDQRRRVWAKNQMILRSLRQTLETLHQAGIPTLLLKGAALLARYYPDTGARSMGDFDILVPHDAFRSAIGTLEAAGWTGIYPVADFDPRFSHAVTLKDGRGNFVDLHWHVLHMTPRADADDRFWAASVPIDLQGVETRSLCAADLVLHLAVHGLRWGPHPPLRWIPDVAAVIARGAPDWDRLVEMARSLEVSLSVRAALEYLHREGFAAVPEGLMAELSSIVPRPLERRLFQLTTHSTLGRYLDSVRLHWHTMSYEQSEAGLLAKLRLVPAYMKYRASSAGFAHWSEFLFHRSLVKHVLGKTGFYENPTIDPRLL